VLRDMFTMVVKVGKRADKHCSRRKVGMGSLRVDRAGVNHLLTGLARMIEIAERVGRLRNNF